MAEFQPKITKVLQTPSTVGQFSVNSRYGLAGVVVSTSQTEIEVCHSQRVDNCQKCPLFMACPASLAEFD